MPPYAPPNCSPLLSITAQRTQCILPFPFQHSEQPQWAIPMANPSFSPTKVSYLHPPISDPLSDCTGSSLVFLLATLHSPPPLTHTIHPGAVSLLTPLLSTVNLNHFRLLRVVGKGAFGKVRIVERKDTGLTFALKYIRKDEGQHMSWRNRLEAYTKDSGTI